jgi:hypothetical protein
VLLWFAWYHYTTSKHRREDKKADGATRQSIFQYDFDDRKTRKPKRDAELSSEDEAAYFQLLNQPKDLKRRPKWKAATGRYNDRHLVEREVIEVEDGGGWWQRMKQFATTRKRRRPPSSISSFQTSQDLVED